MYIAQQADPLKVVTAFYSSTVTTQNDFFFNSFIQILNYFTVLVNSFIVQKVLQNIVGVKLVSCSLIELQHGISNYKTSCCVSSFSNALLGLVQCIADTVIL